MKARLLPAALAWATPICLTTASLQIFCWVRQVVGQALRIRMGIMQALHNVLVPLEVTFLLMLVAKSGEGWIVCKQVLSAASNTSYLICWQMGSNSKLTEGIVPYVESSQILMLELVLPRSPSPIVTELWKLLATNTAMTAVVMIGAATIFFFGFFDYLFEKLYDYIRSNKNLKLMLRYFRSKSRLFSLFPGKLQLLPQNYPIYSFVKLFQT